MQIETAKTALDYKINVKGIIKTIEDSANFKKAISDIAAKEPNASIEIHILDSYIITSSIIGQVLKIIQKDGVKISIYAYNKDLYELIDKLNLVSLLNARKAF